LVSLDILKIPGPPTYKANMDIQLNVETLSPNSNGQKEAMKTELIGCSGHETFCPECFLIRES
jgi:hypothetical protein